MTASKFLFFIYLQYVCVGFCVGMDDIAENFEEVAPTEFGSSDSKSTDEEVSIRKLGGLNVTKNDIPSSESTTIKVITNKPEIEFRKNDVLSSIHTTASRTTLQSVLKTSVEKNTTRTTNLCPYFIYSVGFRMEKMPDVWQPVYYKMADKLKCFKLQIKKTTREERNKCEREYSNFNGTVDWNECHFEIKSSSVSGRKHFLQGGVGDMGVMRNIIIVRDEDNFVLKEESPDQWLMLNGLLLIRDCETGGMVVLTRVPMRPGSALVREALAEIGEEMTGEPLCEDVE